MSNIDPVQGLVDFVQDVKPYHTKIIDVLVEYVTGELIDVAIHDTHMLEIGLCPPSDFLDLSPLCGDGYATDPYGDPGRYNVLSPNPGVSFADYPAIDPATKTFIILGKHASEFATGGTVEINSLIENFVDHYEIVTSNIIDNVFFINGDHTAQFIIGYKFEVSDSATNDGTYTVATPPTFNSITTRIPVVQQIPTIDNTGWIGQGQTVGNINGTFTIDNAVDKVGTLDSWPVISDPSTYKIGDAPHTVIVVNETVPAPVYSIGSETFITYITAQRLEVEYVVTYSNEDEILILGSPTDSLISTPDEGLTWWETISIDAASDQFVVSGNLLQSNIFNNQTFNVLLSDDMNGAYTVQSLDYNDSLNQTTIVVNEDLVGTSTTAVIRFSIIANAFIVDGNVSSRFTPGVEFIIQGGTFAERYQVYRSDYVDGKTRIRVTRSLFPTIGRNILNIVGSPLDSLVVDGNVVSVFPIGTTFNVAHSITNDYHYTVTGTAIYDSGAGITTIPTDGIFNPFDGGSIYVANMGFIRNVPFDGFAESNKRWCGVAPATVVDVLFHEDIRFSNQYMDVSDDIIAYNMENNDSWGFESPINMLIEAIVPTIPVQVTAPSSPTLNDLWYDDVNKKIRQWNNLRWEFIVKAYWRDTTTHAVYVNTWYPDPNDSVVQISTGWLLFTNMFGFNSIMSGVGAVELIGQERFTVGSYTDVTYTLQTLMVPLVDPGLIRVFINNVPANITLNSGTEFTVLTPKVAAGDEVLAEVFDTTAIESNVHVNAFQNAPHQVYHNNIIVDDTNNAYTLLGGNWLDRFEPSTTFEGIGLTGSPIGDLGTWRPVSYPVISVAGDGLSITLSGDLTWMFIPGSWMRQLLTNAEHHDMLVGTSNYDGGANLTTITISAATFASSPGTIMGAVYYPQDISGQTQPTTTVAVTTVVDTNVEAIQYQWLGPLRFEVSMELTDAPMLSTAESFSMANELISLAGCYEIVDTDATLDTFSLNYNDPVTLQSVSLVDSFTPGTYFKVQKSIANGQTVSGYNNYIYKVKTITYNDPLGSPSGNGDTVIEIETDYDLLPPTNSFTVVSITNNGVGSPMGSPPGGSPSGFNILELSGDVTNILSRIELLRPSENLVSLDYESNVMTILDVIYNSGTGNTEITINEDFIDTVFTGVLGLVDAAYSVDILYDEIGGGSPWVWEHGCIEHVAGNAITAADTTFNESFSFGWGTTYTWPITHYTLPNGLSLDGDFTNVIDVGDDVTITGSDGNDDTYEVLTVVYDSGNVETDITVTPNIPNDPAAGSPDGSMGYLQLDQIDITTWYQYLIVNADSTLNTFMVFGDATSDIQNGAEFRVLGTLSNNGIYTIISSPVYDGLHTTLSVTSIDVTETGGRVESYKDYGMSISYTDVVGLNVAESGGLVAIMDGGDIITGSFDYPYFDIGPFNISELE